MTKLLPLTGKRSSINIKHWHIEQYRRVIKQACNIEHFQVRSKTAVKNHLFAAICEYVQLQKFTVMSLISNCYSFQRNLFNDRVYRKAYVDNDKL